MSFRYAVLRNGSATSRLGARNKTELSHRIDQEEFWGRQRFGVFDAVAVGLRAWETRYNHERFPLGASGVDARRKLPAPAA